MMKIAISLMGIIFFMSACSSPTPEQKDADRSRIDKMAQTAIDKLVKKNPNIQKELDNAVGYAVTNMKLTKIPIVGAGGGEGVIVDDKTKERKYFTVSRFDVGVGWGVRSFKVLTIINNKKTLEKLKKGEWIMSVDAEASAGKAAGDLSTDDLNADTIIHNLQDGGASITSSLRIGHAKINKKLTQKK